MWARHHTAQGKITWILKCNYQVQWFNNIDLPSKASMQRKMERNENRMELMDFS